MRADEPINLAEYGIVQGGHELNGTEKSSRPSTMLVSFQ